MLRQLPTGGGAHAHQIGAAVMIDDPLWPAGGARGVVQRQRLPFIGRHLPVEIRVAGGKKTLIILIGKRRQIAHRRVADVNHTDTGPHLGRKRVQRRPHRRGKGGIGDQHPAIAMFEDIGDGLGFNTGVDRIQNTARHRHTGMRLEHLRRVCRDHRYRVAKPIARLCERRCKAAHAGIAFSPTVAALAIDNGGTVRKQIGCPGDEAEW